MTKEKTGYTLTEKMMTFCGVVCLLTQASGKKAFNQFLSRNQTKAQVIGRKFHLIS